MIQPNDGRVDYVRFYRELFAPLEKTIGPIDRNTIFAIIGFDAGGPLNFNTICAETGNRFITYISCELAVRPGQRPSNFGRYELLTSCDDEAWVRHFVSAIGRMSLVEAFDDGHTLDFGPCVAESDLIQGVLFEKVCATEIDRESYGVLRCIGITRAEMAHATREGTASLLEKLKLAHVYPNTEIRRNSVF